MNIYEIYIDKNQQYWIISTHSIRYEVVQFDKQWVASFNLKADARQFVSMKDETNNYYEIYV